MNTNHHRPLFHEKTVARAVRNFAFPFDMDSRKAVIRKWIEALNSRTLEGVKEVSLHGVFLGDIFGTVLGYASVVDGTANKWTLHAETTISDGGGSADGALGFFNSTETVRGGIKLVGRVIAPVELKGVRNDLDRPCLGRTESAVDQGWRYMQYTENCEWLIVSNYREIRLYKGSKTPGFCEKFMVADLADDQNFRRFFYLLCAQNFLPIGSGKDAQSTIDQLFNTSESAEADITRELYSDYKTIRLTLVEHLQKYGPAGVPPEVLIEKAQKLLDRVLFVAFCEDRGLLPKDTFRSAHDHRDPYNPTSIWTRYKSVFRWVDQGREDPPIPGYNGGLFKPDPILDDLIQIPDAICTQLNRLTRFDFDTDVSVEVLGHIFEQSVTDLEELKASSAGREFDKKKGTRKTTGVYYTPTYITQYIVDLALGGHLRRREEKLRERIELEFSDRKQTRKALNDKEIRFWESYREEVLKKTRVLDPACGSGAFLIAAFDFLHDEYRRVNEALIQLQCGQYELFDLNKTILSQNLFGVDLSKESVEITKLSLWLKTAARDKPLTTLDDNIQHGNSVVADPTADPAAFDWKERFKAVFDDGGFDVVIGNPPYVRQELLAPFKPYLQQHFQSFNGVADLYTYFYERGFQVLKPGGDLSFIVTNKWLKSGYGEALRQYFAEFAVIDQIVDFGHAPIFEDADTFPCIILVRKPEGELPTATETLVCPVPREELGGINLSQYVSQNGFRVPSSRFGAAAWSLEHPDVDALMEKIRRVGVPLAEFAGVKPYRGVLTGLNEAFLIDTQTRDRLVREDPACAEIIKPFLRGQDIKRWSPEWAGLWMIFARRGIDIDRYPSVKNHLLQYRQQLEPRPVDWDAGKNGEWPGRKPGTYKWFEIQDSVDYWKLFSGPKLITQDLATYSWFSFDESGAYPVNTCYIWPTSDLYLLGWMCSPAAWWVMHRSLQHSINDTLRMFRADVEGLPIPSPSPGVRNEVEQISRILIGLTRQNQNSVHEVLNWLVSEFHLESPGNALSDFASLDAAAFIDETRKRLPKKAGLTPNNVRQLNDVYREYALPIQTRLAEMRRLEARLSDLVNQAYRLTPDEIALMWRTAPPRMPIVEPQPRGVDCVETL